MPQDTPKEENTVVTAVATGVSASQTLVEAIDADGNWSIDQNGRPLLGPLICLTLVALMVASIYLVFGASLAQTMHQMSYAEWLVVPATLLVIGLMFHAALSLFYGRVTVRASDNAVISLRRHAFWNVERTFPRRSIEGITLVLREDSETAQFYAELRPAGGKPWRLNNARTREEATIFAERLAAKLGLPAPERRVSGD